MVVVVDDENRENEGDLICAAQFATPEQINFMATEARGLICLAMEGERLDALDLPLMVDRNTDSNQTAFTVSVDAGPENGVSRRICAAPATSFRCAPSRAVCSNALATPRPPLIWPGSQACTQPV
jgi:3,4-dihydroxy-2-butanone 4-phosphate synthase